MLHSPSSVSLAMRCRRAWWLRYRDKLKPPELTWAQVLRMQARGQPLPVGAKSKALGKEVHRLAEIYLAVDPAKVAARRLIDWNELPGQCLAELVPHLPPAGSVSKRDLERRVTVKVNGVSFQGLIDLCGAAAQGVVESYDHKTTGDIRAYALLPDAVAVRTKQPTRSLKNDLQSCVYVLARARETRPVASGGLCRWNYTETKRSRRSLPVLQYVPTAHARTIVERASVVAKGVEGFRTRDDATPDTTACNDYGGCWYRAEGHCTVKRRWGLVLNKWEREQREIEERKIMGKSLSFSGMRKATEAANAEEERKAAKAKAKAKAAPVEPDDEDEGDEDAPESEPAPKAKRKAAPVEADDEDDSDDAPESEPAPKAKREAKPAPSPRAAAAEKFTAATSAPDHVIQFFNPTSYAKGEARIIATGFAELAAGVSDLPRNPERAQALRKLLEARDCAVRACTGEDA